VADDGSILQRIVHDHWPSARALILRFLPADVGAAAAGNVERALRCRTEDIGFARYKCENCQASHTVHFSCKSRFCPSCGRARAAEAAVKAQGRLLNVEHQHITLSVPAELRQLLFENRCLLSVVSRAAASTVMQAFATRCRAHAPIPGVMATVHTYGRDLGFHVHVHVLVTRGGLRADGVWQPVKFFPASQYRKLWRDCLLNLLRKKLKGKRGPRQMIGSLFRKYPDGFIANVTSMYRSGKKAAAYCCRYTGRPPLSERRIIRYDGQNVTIAYTDYRDKKNKELTLPAAQFLFRLLQHTWPRYMRDIHYYGLYQPARRKDNMNAVANASRYGDQVRPVVPISRRERLIRLLTDSPRQCKVCGGFMLFQELQLPRRTNGKARKARQGAAGQLTLRM
jgi:hypothetical protein